MIELNFQKIDKNIQKLTSAHGEIFVSPGMQGRIFCTLDNKILHRFDNTLAFSPSPVNFNNIGGNSLWPAPEGGDFAYNYPPNGEWYVQKDINSKPFTLVSNSKNKIVISRDINLLNRKGIEVKMTMSRSISLLQNRFTDLNPRVRTIAYRTLDKFTMSETYSADHVLIGAWSLEQFDMDENIVSFGIFDDGDVSVKSLNTDFYADPTDSLAFAPNVFSFKIGGPARKQIALHKNASPRMIGAYIPSQNLWILRCNRLVSDGIYFNIADNEQPDGPFSSADTYSIFNGAEQLGFFELETIAPMSVGKKNTVGGSTLGSETYFFKGDSEYIVPFMKNFLNVNSIPFIF